MYKFNDLPLIDFIFDEESGNVAKIISMVTHPAIEQDAMAFNNEFQFKVEDKVKRLFTGPAMRPDVPIYRNINGFEFMGRFSSIEIEKFRDALFRDNNHSKTSINHDGIEILKGVYIVESWIVEDPLNDKSRALGFKEQVKGDWYTTYKVEDDKVWEAIMSGDIRGFSIEGSFGLWETALNQHNNDIENNIKVVLGSNNSDIVKASKIKSIITKYYNGKFDEERSMDDILKDYILNYLETRPDFGLSLDDLVGEDYELDMDKYAHELDDSDYSNINDSFSIPDVNTVDSTSTPTSIGKRNLVTVYKYASSNYDSSNIGDNTRDFCRRVVEMTNRRLLTFKEITELNNQNPGLGKGGSDTYSVFEFRGGSNCNHKWFKFVYDFDKKQFIKPTGGVPQPEV